MGQTSVAGKQYSEAPKWDETPIAADPVLNYMNADQLKKAISNSRKEMEKAAKELDFIQAAKYRDEILSLEKLLKEKEV